MNGGYIIISKNQADTYALSLKALELGKPVLFYEDDTTCYYIDTISKSGTDIVLTKGGKTITIESDGNITETGEVYKKLYYHPLIIFGTSDKFNLSACIINDNNTLITKDTLIDTIKNFSDEIFTTLNTSGFYNDNGTMVSVSAIVYHKSSSACFMQGLDTTGVLRANVNITKNDILRVEDRVNLLN